MKRKAQLGFGLGLHGGLGDLLVPVVIIVILALIAVPAFNDYRARVRVAEGIRSAGTARAAVEKAFVSKGPADLSQDQATGWTPPAPTDYLQSIAIGKDGTITLRFTDKVAPADQNEIRIVPMSGGKPLDLSLAASAGRKFEWQCGGSAGKTTLPEKYRPKECR